MRKILIITALAAMLAGCVRNQGPYRRAAGETWGTFYNITYRSDHGLDDSIKAVMTAIDGSLSPFADGSIVSRINRGENPDVDSMFVAVFNTAREVSRLSGSKFDPTVAPLVNLWGFGYKEGSESPSDEQIATALAAVGIAECTIADGRVVKKTQSTEFDFSAIAKGYGCDMVARMLERNGCHDYLVEIGGEIAVKGVNERGEKWRVQIDAPVESRSDVVHERAALISVSNCGIATSGNYRNFRDTSNGRVGHTISPLTGRPAVNGLLAVTVIAPDAMWADALATACMVMSPEESRRMIDSLQGVEALFIAPGDGSSPYIVTATAGFPELLDN